MSVCLSINVLSVNFCLMDMILPFVRKCGLFSGEHTNLISRLSLSSSTVVADLMCSIHYFWVINDYFWFLWMVFCLNILLSLGVYTPEPGNDWSWALFTTSLLSIYHWIILTGLATVNHVSYFFLYFNYPLHPSFILHSFYTHCKPLRQWALLDFHTECKGKALRQNVVLM